MEQKQLNLENMSREIIALKQEMEKMKEFIKEDLEFAIKTELAWQRHDRGEFTRIDSEEFLKEIKKW